TRKIFPALICVLPLHQPFPLPSVISSKTVIIVCLSYQICPYKRSKTLLETWISEEIQELSVLQLQQKSCFIIRWFESWINDTFSVFCFSIFDVLQQFVQPMLKSISGCFFPYFRFF